MECRYLYFHKWNSSAIWKDLQKAVEEQGLFWGHTFEVDVDIQIWCATRLNYGIPLPFKVCTMDHRSNFELWFHISFVKAIFIPS